MPYLRGMHLRSLLVALGLALLAACGAGEVSALDAGHDAGTPDAGARDAGPEDAGSPDAGAEDAGSPDAGPADAGLPDAGCTTGGTSCSSDGGCPATATACQLPACTASCCGVASAPVGTTCNDSGGSRCNGAGACVQCNLAADCPSPATVCQAAHCSAGACAPVPVAVGAPCAEDGGVVCDGAGACTTQHCQDAVRDADETDVDCGGASCQACIGGRTCLVPRDCQSGYCNGAAHACAACTDDAQCPGYCDLATGTCVATRKPQAAACLRNAMCTTFLCADGVCCGQPCAGTCSTCNLFSGPPGTCVNVPPGQNNPNHPCTTGTSCNGAGVCQ
jgi:hypothetical protein